MFRLGMVCAILLCASVVSAQESVDELKARVAMLVGDAEVVEASTGSDFADRILSKMKKSRTGAIRPATTSTAPKSLAAKAPHLTAVLWDSGCVHGEAWYANAYPALKKKGWRIDVRRVPIGHTACPSFTLGDEHWTGYTTLEAHYAKLKSVLHPETNKIVVTQREAEYLPPVQVQSQFTEQPRLVQLRIPPARQQWNYYGSGSLADHLRSTHGIDPSGMSLQDMNNAHSHAHEGTWGSVFGRASTVQPQRSYSRSYQARPVRRVVAAALGGCPSGNCP